MCICECKESMGVEKGDHPLKEESGCFVHSDKTAGFSNCLCCFVMQEHDGETQGEFLFPRRFSKRFGQTQCVALPARRCDSDPSFCTESMGDRWECQSLSVGSRHAWHG